VTAIHGIADADVADKPSFADVAGQVLGFFANCDLAGFNAARFDIPMLVQEFARNGMSFSVASARVVDAQKIFHMREPRTLSAALRFYCGEEHVDAHGALADVEATIKVLDGQCERYTDLPRSVVELDQVCNPRPPDALDPEGKIAWRDNEAVMNFGQKKGIPLRTMAADEPSYLRWMLNKSFSEEAKQLVRDALDGRFPTRKSST